MIQIHELRRTRKSLRRELGAVELSQYHKWADDHIFKEVKKERKGKVVRERVKKYGKTRYQVVFE